MVLCGGGGRGSCHRQICTMLPCAEHGGARARRRVGAQGGGARAHPPAPPTVQYPQRSRRARVRGDVDRREMASANDAYREAKRHVSRGEYTEARALYRALTEQHPAEGRYWLSYAQMEARSGNLDGARRLFRNGAEATRRSPSHLYHAWAVLEERAGNVDDARNLFKRCIALNPHDILAYQAFALLEERQGNVDAAIEIFERAIGNMPSAAAASARRGGGGSNSPSRTVTSAHFWNAYGVVLQKHKRYDDAARCFQQAVEYDAAHCRSWQAWAICEEQRGNVQEAARLFERALAVDPFSAPTYQAYALCEARSGRINDARSLFAKGLKCDPHHAPIYHSWALLEESEGNYEVARDILERGLRKDPESSAMLRAWAGMELKLGHIDSSREWTAPFLPEKKVRKGQLKRSAENLVMLRRLIERRTGDDVRAVLTWLNRKVEGDLSLYKKIKAKGEGDASKLLEWASRRSKQDIEAFESWFDKWYEQDRRIGAYIFGWDFPKRILDPPDSGLASVKAPIEWYRLKDKPRCTLSEADDEFYNDEAVEYTLIAEFLGSFAANLANRVGVTFALLGMCVLLLGYGSQSGLYDMTLTAPSPLVHLDRPSGVDAALMELHDESDRTSGRATLPWGRTFGSAPTVEGTSHVAQRQGTYHRWFPAAVIKVNCGQVYISDPYGRRQQRWFGDDARVRDSRMLRAIHEIGHLSFAAVGRR
ncbi:PsbB mRNA maturation factor Mbb1, chloroplastic [Porphyridium purpureum]|uniref:PsbB mRNA maturation factor Mbb1, chloroplastic n=1 Tax=Porphyridium purpureum TaxID=35688 RepID=A0A5J4YYQ5_PORPP|nr:PsbB mRNA maturation factor Mbb1, chloroplastic [Porphyridium purpureum]|eukprot:POR6348..scf209_3